MDYQVAIEYLNSFINYEKINRFDYGSSFRLTRMRRLAASLGDPQRSLRCIHIAGTKGKGSTAAMTASILRHAGFKTGLYTSPHLISFRERISINDEAIGESDLARLVSLMRPAIEGLGVSEDDRPTFFEVYTALALLFFKEKAVDLAVIEVGMGGRLDATNIIEPLCCAITPISLEHTQILGATVRAIAVEKAGIVKEGIPCVSAPQEADVAAVLRDVCAHKKSLLREVGRDILFEEEVSGASQRRLHLRVRGACGEYPHLESGLLGDHQMVNAATAIGLVEYLRTYDIIIPYSAVRDGLREVKWPGRFQIIGPEASIIVDGAQNSASARSLKEAVKKTFGKPRLILVLGFSQDKDIAGVCDELVPISNEVILTKAASPRAQEPEVIMRSIKKKVRVTRSVPEALALAGKLAGSDALILVTGSLFVVGEVLQLPGMNEASHASRLS
ncbi:MAG: folylpolyglutamate synthase/dihydrofolate synthase family protein [Candidatus Omnitrophota bacterium]